jgi:hypothetical protein
VIKAWFPYEETEERIEAAQTECARWNSIYRDYWWQNFCHVVAMDNGTVFLVLPFVHSIDTDEKAKVLGRERVSTRNNRLETREEGLLEGWYEASCFHLSRPCCTIEVEC